jgi:hypothetical protein
MTIKYTILRPSKIYTNWDFDLKTNHLATLSGSQYYDLKKHCRQKGENSENRNVYICALTQDAAFYCQNI